MNFWSSEAKGRFVQDWPSISIHINAYPMYVIALAHSTIFLQFSTLSPCSPCLCIELWQKRSVWCQISLGRDLQRGFNMFRSNNYVQIIQCSGHSVACQRLLLQTLMAKGVPTTTNVYRCGITWLVLGQSWALHSINVSSMYSMSFHECSMTFQCTIIGLLGLVQVLTSLDAFWSIDALMLPQAPTAQLLQLLQLHLNYARTHLTSSDPQFFCRKRASGLLWSAGLPFHCLGELFQPYEKGGCMMQPPTSQHTVSPHITTTSWPRRKPQSLRFS